MCTVSQMKGGVQANDRLSEPGDWGQGRYEAKETDQKTWTSNKSWAQNPSGRRQKTWCSSSSQNQRYVFFFATRHSLAHLTAPLPPPPVDALVSDNWQEATIILCLAVVALIYLVASRAGGEAEKNKDPTGSSVMSRPAK
jgi:hypothetical protein